MRNFVLCLAAVVALAPLSAQQVNPSVVISQVYGGGGNTSAPYTHDFVELFNRSAAPVSLSGWSIQYASATGTGNLGASSTQLTELPNVVLQPGQYYLVQQASGATGAALPTPDLVDATPINMSGTGGKVALVNQATTIGCNGGSTPCNATQLGQIIDLVGYGTANFFESASTPALSNTTAALRKSGGCTDTNNNNSDFTVGAPAPRNTATTVNSCGGSVPVTLSVNDATVTEGNSGTTNVNLTVSLSGTPAGSVSVNWATQDGTATLADSDYQAGSGLVTLSSAVPTATITVTINGDTKAEPTETFTVVLTSPTNGATLAKGTGLVTIANDDVANCGSTKISQVQGSGASTPLAGQTVSVEGIVTNLETNGFFLQEEDSDADGNPATSEGLFVFTSTAPSVALRDRVCVAGTASEFRTMTQISSVTAVTVSASSQPLPTAITLSLTDPSPSGAVDQLERYEGMLVSGTFRAVTGAEFAPSSGTNSFFWGVVPGQPTPFREPGIRAPLGIPVGSLKTIPPIPRFDANPESVGIDTRQTNLLISGGQTVSNIVGTLESFDGAYTIFQQTGVVPTVSGPEPRVDATGAASGQISVASANLEFYTAGKQAKTVLYIANVLKYPAILAVQETGAGSLAALATALSVGGRSYVSYQGTTGGTQLLGFLVDTSRVTVVTPPYEILSTDRYIDPSDGTNDLVHDRFPFVLEARAKATGGPTFDFKVVNVHMRSLIGIDSDAPEGLTTDGNDARTKRFEAAKSLATWIQSRQVTAPAERIMLTGDFNAFEVNDGYVDVIGILRGTEVPFDQVVLQGGPDVNPDLSNLLNRLTATERFSYVHDGYRQVLDHMLVTSNFDAHIAKFEYAHGNAEFADFIGTNAARPERVADHDNPVAYIALPNAAPITVPQTQIVAFNTPTTFTLNASEPDGQALTFSTAVSPAKGGVSYNNAARQATYTPAANSTGGDTFTYAASDGSLSTNGTVKILHNVTSQTTVVFGGLILDRVSGTYRGTARVTNRTLPLSGPLHLYFDSLPAGVNVVNRTGLLNGKPYITIGAGMAAGAVVNVQVVYSAPVASRPIASILSGTF